MRKYMQEVITSPYKLIAVDDDAGILDSLKVVLKRSGYDLDCYSNPLEAIEAMKNSHYDLLLLDFIMDPIHGDEVVEQVRKFDKIFIFYYLLDTKTLLHHFKL